MTSLYEYARDAPASFEGRVPRPARTEAAAPPPQAVPLDKREELIAAEIVRLLDEPQDLHDRLAAIGLPRRRWLGFGERAFGVSGERLAALGRWMIRHATDEVPLTVGLALLDGHVEPGDVEVLRALARYLFPLGDMAVRTLASAGETTGTLIEIAESEPEYTSRNAAVAALCLRPEAVPWLLRHGVPTPEAWGAGGIARALAEAVDLAAALREHRNDPEVVRHGATLLLTPPRQRGTQSGFEAAAVEAYRAFAEVCGTIGSTVDDLSRLALMAGDLYFSASALLPWAEGERDAVASALLRVLAEGLGDGEGERADWLRGTPRRIAEARDSLVLRQFAVVWVPSDPAGSRDGRTALLAHGKPVLTTEFFTSGYGGTPGLRPDGPLRAGAEPHEAEIANADCHPPCCGGLFATIRREGGEVVWDAWRQTFAHEALDMPPLRFDAAEYDAEIARAESLREAR